MLTAASAARKRAHMLKGTLGYRAHDISYSAKLGMSCSS